MATATTKLINPSIGINEIPQIINICFKAKITPNFVGTQGIGKSQAVRQFAEQYGYNKVIDLRLGQMEIGDLIGLPKTEKIDGIYKTIWGQPVWWPEDKDGKTVLFLDEWNRAATTDVIQAIFQLILDRKLHTHVLPNDCVIVAAMNPADSGFMVNKIRDKALSDRLLHVNVQPTSEEWLKWAAKTKVDADIIDYIRINSSSLGTHSFTMEKREPTPRAFDALSRVFKACTDAEWESFATILCSGLIGPELAMQFIKFKADRNYKPFSAEDILVHYTKNKAKLEEWSNRENFRADVVIATLDNLKDYFESFKTLEEFKKKYSGAKLKSAMDNYAAFVASVPKDVAKKHSQDILKLLATCEDTYVINLVKILTTVVDVSKDTKEKPNVGTK